MRWKIVNKLLLLLLLMVEITQRLLELLAASLGDSCQQVIGNSFLMSRKHVFYVEIEIHHKLCNTLYNEYNILKAN